MLHLVSYFSIVTFDELAWEMCFRQCRTFVIQNIFPAWEAQEGGVAKVCLKGMKWELRRKGQEWKERSGGLENSYFNKNVVRF